MKTQKQPPKRKNKIESRAKDIALAFERQRLSKARGRGRASEIIEVEGCGYEIKAPDGRKIEVKGSKGNQLNKGFVLNSELEAKSLREGGYIYRIVNVNGRPEIHILTARDVNIRKRYRADVRVRSDSKHSVFYGSTFQQLTDRTSERVYRKRQP